MALSRRVLGRLVRTPTPSVDPAVSVIGDATFSAGTRYEIEYAVADCERIRAWLFVPKRQMPGRPAVLCLHQHAGQYEIGKSEPAGLVGSSDQAYAIELAERGFVTLAPDALCFETRRDTRLDGGANERFIATELIAQGTSLQAIYTRDARRALDVLSVHADVNPHAIGCIGHSLGGQQTLFLAAIDRRVRAAVSSCGFATLDSIARDRINHNFALYVPGFRRYGDVGELIALVAPRAFLAFAGEADRIFPIDGVRDAVRRAESDYGRTNASDRLLLRTLQGGHGFPAPAREEAYSWLAAHLAPRSGA